MKTIFVARQFLDSESSLRRVDEEAFFDSFEKARAFLRDLEEEDHSTKDLLYFRHEIEEVPINITDNWSQRKYWLFNLNGDLLHQWPTENNQSQFEIFEFEGKFHKSEIVKIKSNYDNKYSNSIEGTYGVICVVPEDKKAWISNGNEPDAWDQNYVVNYITTEGILSHSHLPEEALEKHEGELPRDLEFLNIYSDYVKNDGNVEHANIIKEVIAERLHAVERPNFFSIAKMS